jgi:ABC-type Fe3+ transport system permease subunit
MILADIILPQMGTILGYTSGLAAFWSIGDFAISSIVVSGDKNLGLLIYSLMGNYRINAALTLSAPLLVTGGLLFAAFVGVGRVFSRRSVY